MPEAETREPEEQQEVGRRFGQDFHRLENGELDSLVLLAEFGKEDGGQAVAEQDAAHIADYAAVTVVSQGGRDVAGEGDQHGEKRQVQAENSRQGVGIDLLGILIGFVGEAETARFQAQHQDDLENGDVGHEFRHDTVLHQRQCPGVNRHKKEIQYTGQDGAETIYRCLTCQLLQRIRHRFVYYLRKNS